MIMIDYETRSRADLTQVGAYKYARDPSTDILCVCLWDIETGAYVVIDPIEDVMPAAWRIKLIETKYIMAHNAAFDREIHEHVGVAVYKFPPIPLRKWYCTAAQARLNGLPAKLEDAAIAAKIIARKDHKGSALIKKLSIPQADGTFNEDPQLMKDMMDYCVQDCRTQVELFKATRLMTEVEHEDYILTEKMNIRGVKIDRELAQLATAYAEDEQSEISAALVELTGGEIEKPTQYQRIKKYILDALDMDDLNDIALRKLMTVYKGKEKKISMDKDVRESIITAVDAGNLFLYEDIEELIRLLDAASASSVSKFKRMDAMADNADDRVRGAFIHAGAGQTHRYSSKGLQLHNMKRDCFTAEQALEMRGKMMKQERLNGVMQTLSKLLRPALIPAEGHSFVVGDWSAIEARALPWLSNDPRAEKKLDLFRQGIDVYVEAAKGIFQRETVDPESNDRQIGKVAELALGYGGAAGAFSSMAKNYGLVLPDYMVQKIVKGWRAANPWAVKFWRDLENAAKNAVRSGGKKVYKSGRVEYRYLPNLLGGTLICILPDGTGIQYPFCRLEHSQLGDNLVALKAGIKPKADGSSKHHWGTVRLWGGLLAENITQAFCAALLRHAVRDCQRVKIPVIAHVHDEIIAEVLTKEAETYASGLKIVMETVPPFAEGLPLKAEPVILDRYGNH